MRRLLDCGILEHNVSMLLPPSSQHSCCTPSLIVFHVRLDPAPKAGNIATVSRAICVLAAPAPLDSLMVALHQCTAPIPSEGDLGSHQ